MTTETAAAAVQTDDATENERPHRQKGQAVTAANAEWYDHVVFLWRGPYGKNDKNELLSLIHPKFWLDRERKVLTELILHARWVKGPNGWRFMTNDGWLVSYLRDKADLSKSEWFRAMAVLTDKAKVVTVHHHANPKSGKQLASDYELDMELLFDLARQARPADWPAAPVPKEIPPGPLALELEALRKAAGISDESIAPDAKVVTRAERMRRALEAARERIENERRKLADRESACAALDAQAEAILARHRVLAEAAAPLAGPASVPEDAAPAAELASASPAAQEAPAGPAPASAPPPSDPGPDVPSGVYPAGFGGGSSQPPAPPGSTETPGQAAIPPPPSPTERLGVHRPGVRRTSPDDRRSLVEGDHARLAFALQIAGIGLKGTSDWCGRAHARALAQGGLTQPERAAIDEIRKERGDAPVAASAAVQGTGSGVPPPSGVRPPAGPNPEQYRPFKAAKRV